MADTSETYVLDHSRVQILPKLRVLGEGLLDSKHWLIQCLHRGPSHNLHRQKVLEKRSATRERARARERESVSHESNINVATTTTAASSSILVRAESLEVLVFVDTLHNVELLGAMGREHGVERDHLQHLGATLGVLLNDGRRVNVLVRAAELQKVANVRVVAVHQRVVAQLELLTVARLQHRGVDLARENVGAQKVLAVEAQADLLENVVDLVDLLHLAERLDLHLLQHARRVLEVALCFHDLGKRARERRSLEFHKDLHARERDSNRGLALHRGLPNNWTCA